MFELNLAVDRVVAGLMDWSEDVETETETGTETETFHVYLQIGSPQVLAV